jgi:MoxR-like ATPase
MIRAAELRPEDVTGPPMPHKEGYSKFHPPLELLQLTKEWHDTKKIEWDAAESLKLAEDAKYKVADYAMPTGKVIIFLDELPNAQPEMQAPLHSLVLDRTFGVGNHTLLDNVRIVAAGNKAEHGAFVQELSAPLRSRFAPHVHVNPTPEEWVNWARKNDIAPEIIAFLPQHEELFYDYDEKSQSDTFASYRTWAMASDILKTTNDDELLLPMLQGTIGSGAAAEFYAFLQTARKAPTAEQIAKNPTTTATFENEPDIALVAVENMVAAARRKPEWVDPFIEYGARMHDQYQEIFFPTLLNLDDTMPRATIEAAIKSKHFGKIQRTAAHIARAVTDGDAAATATTKKKR